MKLMFCMGGFRKGGAERVVCNLANYFVSKGNEVSILVTRFDTMGYEVDEAVKVLTLENRKEDTRLFRNTRLLSRMKKSIVNYEPDVIISFLSVPTLRTLVLKRISKKVKAIPVIVSLRIAPEVSFQGALGKILLHFYKYADGYVFQTFYAKDYFGKDIQRRSVVIANPVNQSFFDGNSTKRNNRIVAVGRLTEQKNFPMLIKAFKMFNSEGKYILDIYGDGELRDELSKMIHDMNLEEQVFLRGNVDDLKNKIKDAKMFVMTSKYEGLSNALMEAMALGTPCISTKHLGGGAEMLINNNENGILVGINDIEALVNAMRKLANDADFYNKISNNSLSSMKKYSPMEINKRWEKYIYKVAKGGK